MTAQTRAAALRLADKSGLCLVRMDDRHFAITMPDTSGVLYCPTDDASVTLAEYAMAFLATFPKVAKRYRKAARRLLRA